MRLLLFLTVLTLPQCTTSDPSIAPDPEVVDYFGADTLSTVDLAERVEVFRLDAPPPKEHDPATAVPGNASIRERVPTPPAPWVGRLRTILHDEDTYLWDIAKSCEPMSGVLVRFHRAASIVDVSFCFECEMLSMAPSGQQKWEDFDGGTKALKTLMKEAFPNDPAIQAL